MRSFFYKNVDSTESVSDRYICVNNFGYYEDVDCMNLCREQGRLDYQLIYVKKGELVVGRGGEERILKTGGICLFRPREAQIYRTKGVNTTFFWIHFSGKEAERMLSHFKEQMYHIGIFPEFESYCHSSLEGINTDSDFSELLYEGRLIALIAKSVQRINSDKKRDKDITKIRPALMAMHADDQAELTNDELARLCGFSKYYFIKLFKDVMGKSPQQYYTSVAVNKGCYLLANTDYNISEISHMCGIEDSLYFSRMFKKQTGLSPRDYRKKSFND